MLGRFLLPLGFIFSLSPYSNSAQSLLLGAVLAIAFGNPYLDYSRKLTRPMLAWAIVGLGAGVNLPIVLKAGTSGIIFTLITLCITLALGTLLGRLCKLDRETSTLINVGTAICGGSAIAAVSSSVNAKNESTSVALGVVFLLNAVGLLIFPTLGHWLALSQSQFGWWGALAIHDTSSVVGATMQYGAESLEIGTTVKLARALWIIPVAILFSRFYSKDQSHQARALTKIPWFIPGFLLVSALFTWAEDLHPYATHVDWIAKKVLIGTLFLIGSSLTAATLRNVGAKAFAHGLTLWILVASGNLAAILFGLVE